MIADEINLLMALILESHKCRVTYDEDHGYRVVEIVDAYGNTKKCRQNFSIKQTDFSFTPIRDYCRNLEDFRLVESRLLWLQNEGRPSRVLEYGGYESQAGPVLVANTNRCFDRYLELLDSTYPKLHRVLATADQRCDVVLRVLGLDKIRSL